MWIEINISTSKKRNHQSLPSRKCGLKYVKSRSYQSQFIVTSLAEVWIEIIEIRIASCPTSVTSLAEVWIEIEFITMGSKRYCVTSLAEVWIEISMNLYLCDLCQSLPSRKCGLKFIKYGYPVASKESLPSRKCGLKFIVRTDKHPACSVTSLAEVWIEIF